MRQKSLVVRETSYCNSGSGETVHVFSIRNKGQRVQRDGEGNRKRNT